MKKIYLLIMSSVFLGSAFAQKTEIDQSYSQKLIERYNHSHTSDLGHRNCITNILKEAKLNQSILSEEAKEIFGARESRPTGLDIVYQSDHFDFHYTDSGSDAIDMTDNDNNGEPDYIENMAAIFESVWIVEMNDMGYTAPPSDGTEGGNEFYDVYVHDIGVGLYGFVAPESEVIDNSNSTSVTEISAYTSWMGMRHEYESFGDAEKALKVTAAHEFFHAVQMGYTMNTTNFVAEATAAWIEDAVYPGIDDNLQYFSSLNSPDISWNYNSDDYNADGLEDSRWYYGWLFFKYLEEKHGANSVRKIYDALVDNPNWPAPYADELVDIDNVLKNNYSSDFTEAFDRYLIASYVQYSEAFVAPYNFTRADDYWSYMINNNISMEEGSITYSGSVKTWDSSTDGNGRLMRLSADYISLSSTSNFQINMTTSNADEMDIALVSVNESTSNFDVKFGTQVGNDIIITQSNASNYDGFAIVVIRYDGDVENTNSSNYSITIDAPGTWSSVNELSSAKEVLLYPNPSNGVLNVLGNDVQGIKISDITGKVVMSAAGANQFNVEHLTAGTYFVNVMFNDGELITKKYAITNK